MAKVSAGDIRNGVTIEVDGKVCQVIDFMHVKPGKGAAFVRVKMKNIIDGGVVETTFRPTETFEQAHIERKKMQYLYNDGEFYNYMDNETFEQIMSSADVDKELAASAKYPAIVVQDGEISTENWSVYGHEPEKYQFYQIERMTDLEKGEIIPMVLYSSEEERQVGIFL